MATEDAKLRNPGGEKHDDFDRDINLKAVVYTGAGLAALTAVSFVLMWFFFKGLASYEERRDPEPSPMPEAARELRPAGPTLQATPERDLEELLAIEHERLEEYGLADDGEHARVPIDRAMEMALERGLGTPGGEAPDPAGAGETVGGDLESPLGRPGDDLVPLAEPAEGETEQRPDTDLSPEGPDGP